MPNANVVTVKGARFIAEKDEGTGKLTLTPAPEIFVFQIEKDDEGNTKYNQLTNSVRAYIQSCEPKGTFELIKSGENLEVRKLF